MTKNMSMLCCPHLSNQRPYARGEPSPVHTRLEPLYLVNPAPSFTKEKPLTLAGEHNPQPGHRAKVAYLNP